MDEKSGLSQPAPQSARASPNMPPPRAGVALRVLSPLQVGRLKWWGQVARVAKNAAKTRTAPPGGLRLSARRIWRGFLPVSGSFYELASPRAGDYVSDRQKAMTWAINWPAAELLDDKLAFFFMMRQLAVPTPEVVGAIVQGRVQELSGGGTGPSAGWVRKRLERGERLVVRPTRGAAGRGVWVLAGTAEGIRLNEELVRWNEVERRLEGLVDHLISEFVEQGAYARNMFPATTNTLRVLTLQDEHGRPFIARAVQRIGTPESAPTDNWTRGGLSALIDLETGELGPGASHPTPQSGSLTWHRHHPSTGAPIAGVRLPGWRSVREGLLAAAAKTWFLPYVGWDVIVTDEGFTVIEGNKYANPDVLQIHGPLMTDPAVRAFFERHRVA